MRLGDTCTVSRQVTREDTAAAVKSGDVPVFATPAMAALMEHAAMQLAARYLPREQTTVGISLSVTHTSATPVGMRVDVTATLTAVEGRTLSFSMKASDEGGIIGEGTQRRAVVDRERFVQKTYARLKQ